MKAKTYDITLILESNIRNSHLISDSHLLFRSLIILNKSTSIKSLQSYTSALRTISKRRHTLQRPDVKHTINITANYSESLRIMMFNPICLFLPCNLLIWIMGVRNDLVAFTEIRFFVFKHIVTDGNDHSFVEIRPGSKYPFTDMLRGDGFGRSSFSFGRSNGDYHTLIPRVGLEDVDTVVPKSTIVGECMERRETSKGACTNTDSLDEAENKVDTITKSR